MAFLNYLDGGGREFTGDPIVPAEGPSQGTPSGGAASASNLLLLTSTGGLLGSFGLFLVGAQTQNTLDNFVFLLDNEDFNTEEDFEYYFREEEIKEGYFPTINRVRLIYEDYGLCKITVGVMSEQRKREVTIEIGSTKPTYKTKTAYADIQITGERPQLYIKRKANAGPLVLIKATLLGEFGDGPQS